MKGNITPAEQGFAKSRRAWGGRWGWGPRENWQGQRRSQFGILHPCSGGANVVLAMEGVIKGGAQTPARGSPRKRARSWNLK